MVFSVPEDAEGFDLGIVTRIDSTDAFNAKRATLRRSNDKEEQEIRSLLRLATSEERQTLPEKDMKEENMLKKCQKFIVDHDIPMTVYGAEFRLDYKLLTFYYTSETRADYRELVKSMYNKCTVRIKMRKTNQCKKFTPIAFATEALKSGVMT